MAAEEYPKLLITNLPSSIEKIALKIYLEQIIGKGRVLDVELLIDKQVALITFVGTQGVSEMSQKQHFIGGSMLKLSQLLDEEATLTLRNIPVNVAIKVHELTPKWGLCCHKQDSMLVITGVFESIQQFRSELIEALVHDEAVHSMTEPLANQMAPPVALPEVTETCTHEVSMLNSLSPDALSLLQRLPEGRIRGVQYHVNEGRITGQTKESITQFQAAYQHIFSSQSLMAEDVAVSPAFDKANTESVVARFNDQYKQCSFSYQEQQNAIRVVSTSSRQFNEAKKLLLEALQPTSLRRQNPEIVLQLINNRRLTLKQANIVEENVDVIMNAANEKLQHGGGVAGALNDASGGALQRHSNEYIHKNGTVQVGATALTHAGGALKCRYVIHAVGPESKLHHPQQCKQLIAQAITQALTTAEEVGAKSIAIPAISSGIYGVRKELVATSILDAIYVHQFKESPPVLSDIRIVIVDEPTYSAFATQFTQRKPHPPHVPNVPPYAADPGNSTRAPPPYSVRPQEQRQVNVAGQGGSTVTVQPRTDYNKGNRCRFTGAKMSEKNEDNVWMPKLQQHGAAKVLTFQIPDCYQGPHHYRGGDFQVYLPKNQEGTAVAKLVQKAFDMGYLFTNVTGYQVGWSDAFQTSLAQSLRSFRDDAQYLKKVKADLAKLGLTLV